MKQMLSSRMPAWNDILLVFAFTAFIVYARTIFIFAWKLPSWLMLLTVGETVVILLYSFAFALAETVGIVLVLVLIGAILPAAWFRDSFVVRGFWAVFVYLLSLWLLFGSMTFLFPSISDILPWWTLVTAALIVMAVALASRLRFMRALAEWFSDRTIVFLYLFLPASVIGLIVLVIRLIFVV